MEPDAYELGRVRGEGAGEWVIVGQGYGEEAPVQHGKDMSAHRRWVVYTTYLHLLCACHPTRTIVPNAATAKAGRTASATATIQTTRPSWRGSGLLPPYLNPSTLAMPSAPPFCLPFAALPHWNSVPDTHSRHVGLRRLCDGQ
jgi:hypothetical protein